MVNSVPPGKDFQGEAQHSSQVTHAAGHKWSYLGRLFSPVIELFYRLIGRVSPVGQEVKGHVQDLTRASSQDKLKGLFQGAIGSSDDKALVEAGYRSPAKKAEWEKAYDSLRASHEEKFDPDAHALLMENAPKRYGKNAVPEEQSLVRRMLGQLKVPSQEAEEYMRALRTTQDPEQFRKNWGLLLGAYALARWQADGKQADGKQADGKQAEQAKTEQAEQAKTKQAEQAKTKQAEQAKTKQAEQAKTNLDADIQLLRAGYTAMTGKRAWRPQLAVPLAVLIVNLGLSGLWASQGRFNEVLTLMEAPQPNFNAVTKAFYEATTTLLTEDDRYGKSAHRLYKYIMTQKDL